MLPFGHLWVGRGFWLEVGVPLSHMGWGDEPQLPLDGTLDEPSRLQNENTANASSSFPFLLSPVCSGWPLAVNLLLQGWY